jgi:hypothetical protein
MEKEARLAFLNADLNIDGEGNFEVQNDAEEQVEPGTGTYGKAKPSLLDELKLHSNDTEHTPSKSKSIGRDI